MMIIVVVNGCEIDIILFGSYVYDIIYFLLKYVGFNWWINE